MTHVAAGFGVAFAVEAVGFQDFDDFHVLESHFERGFRVVAKVRNIVALGAGSTQLFGDRDHALAHGLFGGFDFLRGLAMAWQ